MLVAPRILNEPIGWRLSGFSRSGRAGSAHGQGSSGVRSAMPSIRRAAA
jgi:hypothetical protein